MNVSSLSKLTVYIYDIPTPITSDKILTLISGGHDSRCNTFYYVRNYLQVHPIHVVVSRPYTVCNSTDITVAPLKITSNWRLLSVDSTWKHRVYVRFLRSDRGLNSVLGCDAV